MKAPVDAAGEPDLVACAVVTTTVGSHEDATALARALVIGRLAACVQILPTESVYAWKGTIEEAREWMLICKIRAEDYPEVETAIMALHRYDTPEIVATAISVGSKPYLSWIAAAAAR